MALGDGIRRNVATISREERDRLVKAFLALDKKKLFPDGVSYWDKQEDIHKARSIRAKLMFIMGQLSYLGIGRSSIGLKGC